MLLVDAMDVLRSQKTQITAEEKEKLQKLFDSKSAAEKKKALQWFEEKSKQQGNAELWQSIADVALHHQETRARAEAARLLRLAPLGVLDAECLTDIIKNNSAVPVKTAACNTLFRRLEQAQDPLSYAFLGPILAGLFLAETDPEVKKLLDRSFNELHFSILRLEKENRLQMPNEPQEAEAVRAFEATQTSVEHAGAYDSKYEQYLKNLKSFEKQSWLPEPLKKLLNR